MSRVFIFALLIHGFSAFGAGLSVTSVGGASAYNLTGTVTVLGGVANTYNCASTVTVNTETCNSCTGNPTPCTNTPLCACNTNQIYDTGVVRINLQRPTGVTTGTAIVRTQDNQSNVDQYRINDGTFVELSWLKICTLMGSTTCNPFASATTTYTVHIGIDKDNSGALGGAGEEAIDVAFRIVAPTANTYDIQTGSNDGIDTFTPYPGDEKIYVEDVHSPNPGFPLLTYGAKATGLRVYLADTKLPDAVPGSGLDPQSLSLVDDGGNLDKPVVDGLDNNKLYFFRIAVLDEAQNVVLFYPDMTARPECDTAPSTTCQYSATPSQVLGLLSKDTNCFIATAAYGSALEPRLNTLRHFRNKYLLLNKYGLKFVLNYYKYGPYAARWIADKPTVRALARVGLWPVYAFSYVALRFGLAAALAVLLLGALSLVSAPWFIYRRAVRRG